jgi:hypothetical protein
VAAGRLGVTTLLVEKYGFCGGATVAGLSGTICGLQSSGDRPEQIVFGFADEFCRHLAERDGVKGPVAFGRTQLVPHDSLVWKEVADDLLEESGVQTLYHSHFLNAYMTDDRVDALLVRTVEGDAVIKPRMVVDASGDALVVHDLGGKTGMGRDGVVQTPTMIFRMGNVEMAEFLALEPNEINAAVAEADAAGHYDLPRHHVYLFPLPNGSEVLCNMTRIAYPDGRTPVGTSVADMTFAEMAGRRQAREYARFLQEKFPAFRHSHMVDTGCQVGIRQTRSIAGLKTLSNEDVLQAHKHPGFATRSAWPIEAHGAGDLRIVYLEDDYYEVPFETLIPQVASNLLVAGRCLSAEHEALASARVTAQCFGMGYAVGAACDFMIKEQCPAQSLRGMEVRDWMLGHGLKPADRS